MTALAPIDRALLDFLCSVEANRHCIVRSVKTKLRPSLRRLRYAGLVWVDSFTPSASAMADWKARQDPQSSPPSGGAVDEEPPAKAAAKKGGAVARKVSAPPTSTASATFPCGCPRTPENTKSDHGRYDRCRKCTNERHKLRQREARKLERGDVPRPRKTDVQGQRVAARVRRQTTEHAKARIAQGLDPRTCKNANIRHAQFALQEEMKVAAKLADPIEQAKAALRKFYTPVLSAETTGGPKGQFYVGRKLVSRDELLEMAARRLAA